MEFYSLRTTYQYAKAARQTLAKDHEAYTNESISQMEQVCQEVYDKPLMDIDPFTPGLLLMEQLWAELRMPYYNLWPAVIPALTKLKMDIDATLFALPLDCLLIRLPKGDANPLRWSYEGKDWQVHTILVGENGLRPSPEFHKRHGLPAGSEVPALSLWLDIDERVVPDDEQFRKRMYKHILKCPGWSIERSFKEIPHHESAGEGVIYPEHIIEDCARIVCTLCLMAEDPELVVPDVLSKDKAKYAESRDASLVVKAHNRGKVGWDVGANIEIAPHLRSASPAALYWTGEGRKIPRIRFRKGCIVHRRRLSAVPTGYLSEESEEA